VQAGKFVECTTNLLTRSTFIPPAGNNVERATVIAPHATNFPPPAGREAPVRAPS
jgi:hypothetical protein